MSTALLTPDRGDRPNMLEHCKWQVSRFVMNLNHIVVNGQPKNTKPDLTERIKQGYDQAVKDGIDWLIIVENDDFYPMDYPHVILRQADKSDFIGSEFTFYYNLKNKTWERLYHPNHCSLFHTAFRVSAMKDFKWHLAHKLFLDLDIWKYARRFRRTFVQPHAIGIKGHGEGLVGGKGHQMVMKNKDPDMAWLKSKVDERSFELYKSLT